MSSVVKIGHYRLGRTLGVGSFGKVKVAEHELTGHKVAVKILNREKIKSMGMDEKIRREIHILKLFVHPHIIRLYQVIETPTDIFLIMEYVSGGELFDYIVSKGRLSEDEGRRFFQQIISGVEYCHNHMVVHRDLKPENLLLDETHTNVKIADFGLSNLMKDGEFLRTSCGSPNYAAPEVISGKLYAGPEVDVWSCGVILYALLCGRLPFDDESIPNLFRKIKGGIYVLPSYLPQDVQELIQKTLVVDSLKRITIADIRRHPWFETNLPPYLQSALQRGVQDIDTEVLDEVLAKFGDSSVTREDVIRDIGDGTVTHITAAYNLTVDAKLRELHQAEWDDRNIVDTEFDPQGTAQVELGESLMMGILGSSIPGSPMPNSFMARRPELSFDAVDRPLGATPPPSSRLLRWYLGVHSRRPPGQIMAEVYRALRILKFEWKTVTPYLLRCRVILDTRIPPQLVKIGITLYKVHDKRYLLDFHKLEGDIFLFFDLCGKLITLLSGI